MSYCQECPSRQDTPRDGAASQDLCGKRAISEQNSRMFNPGRILIYFHFTELKITSNPRGIGLSTSKVKLVRPAFFDF